MNAQQTPETDDKIPVDVHLFVCLECGRTNRFERMGQRHYFRGKLCRGEVIRVRYQYAGIDS